MQAINRRLIPHINVDKTSIHLKSTQSTPRPPNLSLIKPDLSGLHDTIYYKQGKTTLFTKIGSIINWFIFTHAFVIGIPLCIISAYTLIFVDGYFRIYAAFIALFIIFPYIFPLQPNYLFNKFMHSWYPHYFDGQLTLSFMTDRSSKTTENNGEMLCAHPHGILCNGITSTVIGPAAFAVLESKNSVPSKKNSKILDANLPIQAAVDPKLYHSPLFKYIVQTTSAFTTTAKQNILKRMRQNKSFSIFPGGFYELGEYQYGKDVVVVPKGFIKYALQFGYKLTPSYCFGANRMYYQYITGDHKGWRFIKRIKDYLSQRNIPFIFFWGKWYDPILPNSNIGVHTIIGPSIQCPKINDRPITSDDIEQYQKVYIDALRNLFDENKWRFGMNHAKLLVKRM